MSFPQNSGNTPARPNVTSITDNSTELNDPALDAAVTQAGEQPELAQELAEELGLSFADTKQTGKSREAEEDKSEEDSGEDDEPNPHSEDFAGAVLKLVLAKSPEESQSATGEAVRALLSAVGGGLKTRLATTFLELAMAASRKAIFYGEISAGMDEMVREGKLVTTNGRYGLPGWVPDDSEKLQYPDETSADGSEKDAAAAEEGGAR